MVGVDRIYVAFDIETTGLDPDRDAIIEIGAVRFKDHTPLATWESLVNPQRPIPYKITLLTGITQEDANSAPSLTALLSPLCDFVRDYPVVGHNIGFDLSFLRRHGVLTHNLALDTFELASILVPKASRYNLDVLASKLGITLPVRHRALADALAAKDLFLALRDLAMEMDFDALQEINRIGVRADWPLRFFFSDIARERARGAFSGASIRRQLVAKGELDDAAMGLVLGDRIRERPLEPRVPPEPVDVEALASMLSPGGLMEREFPGYEHREQQVEMLRLVGRAFNEGQQLLVEAGTGTGKSIAYLIPAIYFAVQNNEHVVISTNTINLQDQLYNKDIPDLQRILPLDFRATLLKGRGNYLCLRRFALFRRQATLSPTEIQVLAKVLAWLPTTDTGDRAELMLVKDEPVVWNQLQAEADLCLGDHCPHRIEGRCFFARARRRAEAAHLIIVNHALLLSDMVTENRVLPEYRYLIVDEAHHLEDQATEQLSFSVDEVGLRALLSAMSSDAGRHGFFAEIPVHFRASSVEPAVQRQLGSLLDQMRGEVDRASTALTELFEHLGLFLDEQTEKSEGETYDRQIRLNSAIRIQPDWSDVEMLWGNLDAPLSRLERGLSNLYEGFTSLADADILDYDVLLQDTLSYLRRITEIRESMNAILAEPDEQGIYWASISTTDNSITLHAAPLHVGEVLRKNLFDKRRCVILTSATLRTGEDFRYLRERLSLQEAEEAAVGSPFDYLSSTLLYLPTDIPEPGQQYYQKKVEQTLIELCRAIGGRTLVLFTSYGQLNECYRAISRPLEEAGIVVYAQGIDGSRRQLLDNFKSTPKAVLLGTRSFWEGIDVVGEALSCLVIVRLPFSVPTDPIFAARSEGFEDPFREYSVPETVLRFRQGFGRLIRSRTDRGVVVVLDKRLQSKSYGPTFLKSLPECTLRRGTLAELPSLAAEWINNRDLVLPSEKIFAEEDDRWMY